MVAEIREFAVTVPAGTTAAAPQLTDLAMPARVVRSIRVRIPPGPRGNVGFRLAAAGTPIVPWNAGAWFVADDEVYDEPLDGMIDSGAWQCQAYNTGLVDHTLYIRFRLDTPGGTVAVVTAPLVITAPAVAAGPVSPSEG